MTKWFSELPFGVTTDIIASFVWIIFAYLFHLIIEDLKKFLLLRGKRKLRSFLGYKKGETVYLVIGTSVHKGRSKRQYPSISAPTSILVYHLADEIKSLFFNSVDVQILLDHQVTEKLYHEHLILICGPAINSIISKLYRKNTFWFSQYSDSIDYSQSINRFFQDSAGGRYSFQSDDDSITDYSLIAKVPNPQNPQKPIIALFGIETFGTSGAILGLQRLDAILKNSGISNEKLNSLRKSSHMEIILKATAIDQSYSEIMNVLWAEWISKGGNVKSTKVPYSITVPKYWS
jgi:hypothetical protein